MVDNELAGFRQEIKMIDEQLELLKGAESTLLSFSEQSREQT